MYINRPNRHTNIDYSNLGYYFIIIFIWKMESVFGINNSGKIILNEYGLIAQNNLIAIHDHFDQIELEEFVIMLNHIHGLLKIKSDIKNNPVRHLKNLHK
jgi:putative transposase